MHEFTLMANLLKNIEKLAKENNGKKVTKVWVTLGALSHITPEHFTEHFEQGIVGSIAEGAILHVTQSTDMKDKNAQEIILNDIEVVEG